MDLAPAEALPIEAEAFLTHLTVERGRSARTISAYRRDLLLLCGYLEHGNTTMTGARAEDLRRYSSWLARRGLAETSRTRMLVSVKGLYRFLATEGSIDVDPAARLETPKRPDALPRALDRPQVESLLDTVGEAARDGEPAALRDCALLEFLYGTGARVSEACGLGFGDVDLDASLVRLLGKRDKERIVPIGRPAARALGEYLDRGRPVMVRNAGARGSDRDSADAVFLGLRGARLSRQAAWEAIRRWSERARVAGEISPHVLRHSCATHLLEGGADVRIVAELLGHASVSTTQVYTRVANDLLFEEYSMAHPRARRRAPRPAEPLQ